MARSFVAELDLGDFGLPSRPLFYILDEFGDPEPADPGSPRMAEWYDISREPGPRSRRVALDQVGPWRVSTVFLMVDHQFDIGLPVLWETMVFGNEGGRDEMQWRYTSRAEAEIGHASVVAALERGDLPHEHDDVGD